MLSALIPQEEVVVIYIPARLGWLDEIKRSLQ